MNIKLSGKWEQHLRCPKCDFPSMNINFDAPEDVIFTMTANGEIKVGIKGKHIECLMCGETMGDNVLFIGQEDLQYLLYRGKGLMGYTVYKGEE